MSYFEPGSNLFYGMELDEYQQVFVKAMQNPKKPIVFCNAVSGTGKTTLAMGVANMLVKDKRNNYNGILYVVSPYGEGRQGYIPGDQTQKSEVYFEPAYQAMIEVGMNPNSDICTESMAQKKRGEGFVKLLTHTYLRGPNMKDKIVIIDEAQNFTVAELKKTLTRLHDSCKAIVVGHTGQVDITGKSGFARYIEHFRGQERAQVCELLINHRGWLSSYADQLQED